MVGPAICCEIQERWGRKAGFLFSGVFTLLGTGLQAGANGFSMFAVGRLFAGIGAWSYMLSSIVYIREQAPVIKRGLLGVLLGPGLISGYIVAAFIGLGFYYVTSPVNWRIPLVLMAVTRSAVLFYSPSSRG